MPAMNFSRQTLGRIPHVVGIALLAGFLGSLQPHAFDHAQAAPLKKAAVGIDGDFYTGPIARDVWLRMKKAGVQFVIAQAWGGRSRNEFAVAQLSGARSIGRMKEAAYVLLNYDDKVCSTFAKPVRDSRGKCQGDLIPQA